MSFRFWKVEKYFHFKTKQLIFWHHSESKEDRRNKINNFKLILRYDLRYIFGVEMQKNCMRNLRTFAIFHLSLCRNCIFNSRFMGKGSLIERAWCETKYCKPLSNRLHQSEFMYNITKTKWNLGKVQLNIKDYWISL